MTLNRFQFQESKTLSRLTLLYCTLHFLEDDDADVKIEVQFNCMYMELSYLNDSSNS